MESVSARLDVQLYIKCPHCKYLIDALNEDVYDNDECLINDEYQTMKMCIPNEDWTESHNSFEIKIECPSCSKEINVKTIEW